MAAPHAIFDPILIDRRRARAVLQAGGDLETPAFLLSRSIEDLTWRLRAANRTFTQAVNLGAYLGQLGRTILERGLAKRLINVDSSLALLTCCDPPCVAAGLEALPFADNTLDLIVSALVLQFVDDLPGTLAQIQRALVPDGLFLASLLGGSTLSELREALILAETDVEGGASPRVAPFADVRDLGALLQRAKFALPVADSDVVRVTYSHPLALMADLRAMGATNPLRQRRRVPLRRKTLERAIAIYRERHGLADGRIIATFEIVTLTGFAPHASQQQPLRPGSARARLADALGTAELPAGETAMDPGVPPRRDQGEP